MIGVFWWKVDSNFGHLAATLNDMIFTAICFFIVRRRCQQPEMESINAGICGRAD